MAGHGVFESERLGGREVEEGEGGEVGVGGGFAVRDVLAADDGGEAVEQAAGGEVAVDVAVGGVGGDGQAKAGVAGGVEQGDGAGEDGGLDAKAAGGVEEAGGQGAPVVSFGIRAPKVDGDADVPDDGVEDAWVGAEAVFAVNLDPGVEGGRLGVHEKSVKIEDETAQRHAKRGRVSGRIGRASRRRES